MSLPVTLSPACPNAWQHYRSGFRWLVVDGGRCSPGQALARCTFTFNATGVKSDWPDRQNNLQLVVVATCHGIVRHASGTSQGGWRDQFEGRAYQAGEVIGAGIVSANICLMINSQRMTSLVDDRESLWSGWHYRQRIWPLGAAPPKRTLLALGICELAHALRGSDHAYSEMLLRFVEPVQLVTRDDVPFVTSARIALEQLTRTEEQSALIWNDLQTGLLGTGNALTPDDWMVAGCFGRMLIDRAIVEGYPVLSVQGITQSAPADCVVLSMMAESPIQLRHKQLGYHIHMHKWLFARLPHAMRQWIQHNFEQVKVSLDEVEHDYTELSKRLQSEGRQLCLLNNIASHRNERIERYVHFQGALEDDLASFRNLSLNVMASHLAKRACLQVVDVDALAAELGIWDQSPDRVHHGPLLERGIRFELASQVAQAW